MGHILKKINQNEFLEDNFFG